MPGYYIKTVSSDKENLVLHSIDFSIVLRALDDFGILFDCKDSLETAGEGKGDGIAPGSSKGVDQNGLFWWQNLGEMLSDFPTMDSAPGYYAL